MLPRMKNLDPAIAALMISAAADDAHAQFLLGYNYYIGNVDENQEIYSAIHWFKKSINNNNTDAMYALGLIYIKEADPIRNTRKGIELVNNSASLGNTKAMYFVALENLKGDLIPQNVDNYIMYLELAAFKYHYNSMIMLANHYEVGDLFPADKSKALALYRFARDADFSKAHELYTKLIFTMDYFEIERSKSFVRIDQIFFNKQSLTA